MRATRSASCRAHRSRFATASATSASCRRSCRCSASCSEASAVLRDVRAALLLLVLGTIGCAAAPERAPLPPELIRSAAIPGIPGARYWGDASPELAMRAIDAQSDAELVATFEGIYGKPHVYLAISGGGANGAYGAGFLVGWTAAGTRPEFTIVTGVSTGALIAPFAFLGSDYDDDVEELYTTMRTKDVA